MKVLAAVETPFLLILAGTSLPDFCLGWSSRVGRNNGCYRQHGKPSKTAVFLSTDNDEHTATVGGIPASSTSTRRDAFFRTLNSLVGGVAVSTALLSTSPTTSSSRFGLVQAAHADVTNKIASSTALRALTRVQSQLPVKVLPAVQANDFVGVKARLREAPFDNVRKNGQTLVRGGEDGPRARELVKYYKELIAALEKIDSTASLGMRGRTIGPLEMTQEYDKIIVALETFLKVGAAAADIPLQAQPSMQDNLRTGSIETKVLTSKGAEIAEAPPQDQPPAQDNPETGSIETKVLPSEGAETAGIPLQD